MYNLQQGRARADPGLTLQGQGQLSVAHVLALQGWARGLWPCPWTVYMGSEDTPLDTINRYGSVTPPPVTIPTDTRHHPMPCPETMLKKLTSEKINIIKMKEQLASAKPDF